MGIEDEALVEGVRCMHQGKWNPCAVSIIHPSWTDNILLKSI